MILRIAQLAGVALLSLAPIAGVAQQSPMPPVVVQMVVGELKDSFITGSQMLVEIDGAKKAEASKHLEDLAKETLNLSDKYAGRRDVTVQDILRDSAKAFELSRTFWKLAESRRTQIIRTGNSDDPHYCSNHCERVCGYNSLGEKICYNRCVKCCNRTSGC